jgi:hypothetical protein
VTKKIIYILPLFTAFCFFLFATISIFEITTSRNANALTSPTTEQAQAKETIKTFNDIKIIYARLKLQISEISAKNQAIQITDIGNRLSTIGKEIDQVENDIYNAGNEDYSEIKSRLFEIKKNLIQVIVIAQNYE